MTHNFCSISWQISGLVIGLPNMASLALAGQQSLLFVGPFAHQLCQFALVSDEDLIACTFLHPVSWL